MHYAALATDYDGTIAHDGVVDDATIAALERLRASSRRIILVTGRELDDLIRVLPRLDLFDRVVAENGALLYRPDTKAERALAEPPPPDFAAALRAAGVAPLSVGRVIVATWEPNETAVLATIRDLGLGLQVIFNKGAVMVLPGGVSKESGLRAALEELEIDPLNCVAVGDAENDYPFLELCGLPVAVANALPRLKDGAALVTQGARGEGAVELIDRLIATDLAEIDATNPRQRVSLAEALDGDDTLDFVPQRSTMLLVGASGGGKSTLTTGLLERLSARKFQSCVIDPEGDYEEMQGFVGVGTPREPPAVEAVSALLRKTRTGVTINLLGVKLHDRPAFLARLLPELAALRAEIGRPHFVVVDEAHHMLPEDHEGSGAALGEDPAGVLFVTIRPQSLPSRVLACVQRILAVGSEAGDALRVFCETRGLAAPDVPESLPIGELLTLSVRDPAPRHMRAMPGEGTRRRHLRKYAEGKLGDDRAFFFRGAEGKLNLRAGNLVQFLDLSDGVDADTWEFHRRRGDYGRWIELAIKDQELAAEVVEAEGSPADPDEARRAIRDAVERRYTLPA